MKRLIHLFRILYWNFIVSPENQARHLGVKIGNNCLIDTRYWSSEPYLISIGNHVQITRGVSIHTHGGAHPVRQFHPQFDVFGKVIIEDFAYIGAFSQIMPGVTIGKGSIVAAGSIVTKSVPPGVVVGGNPAKYICTVDEYYEKNKMYDTGTKGMSSIKKREVLLNLSLEKFIKK